MSKTFNIYCDESTHLKNDGHPYMILGYVSKTYIYDKKEHYVIVLECQRSNSYYLLTAYYLNKEHAEKQLKKKMRRRLDKVL